MTADDLSVRLERLQQQAIVRQETENAALLADLERLRAEEAARKVPPVPAERVYRASEIADRAFYEEHRDAILQAARDRRIVDDAEPPASPPPPPAATPAPSRPTGTMDAGTHGTAGGPRITAASLADRRFYEANRAELERRARTGQPILDE